MISRQKLIEEYYDKIVGGYDMGCRPEDCKEAELLGESCMECVMRRTGELIASQPPADQWIPCSERLPQEDGDYLVWYDCGGDETGYMVVNFDAEEGAFGCWHDAYDSYTLGYVDSEFIEMETAVAWKPVEPYKGVK